MCSLINSLSINDILSHESDKSCHQGRDGICDPRGFGEHSGSWVVPVTQASHVPSTARVLPFISSAHILPGQYSTD